jgi:hypothetical protein
MSADTKRALPPPYGAGGLMAPIIPPSMLMIIYASCPPFHRALFVAACSGLIMLESSLCHFHIGFSDCPNKMAAMEEASPGCFSGLLPDLPLFSSTAYHGVMTRPNPVPWRPLSPCAACGLPQNRLRTSRPILQSFALITASSPS